MVGGYENVVALPSMGVFDTSMMQASISAAREQYNQARDDYKQFIKDYNDFYSPLQPDNDVYYNMTIGQANRLFDQYGGDILRNAEGRNAIKRMINNVDMGKINALKQSAEAAKEYIKNRGALEKAGLFNPDFENFRLNGKSLENWDTSRDGIWTQTSPGEFQTLNAYTSPWFDKLKDSFIETDEQGRDWYGVTKTDMLGAISSNLGGFMQTDLGKYYYQNAKRQLEQSGINNPDQKLIMAKLSKDIIDSNGEVTHKNYEYNAKYMADLKYQNDAKLARLRNSLQIALADKKAKDAEKLLRLKKYLGDGKGSGKSGNNDGFVESQYQLARTATNIVGNSSYGAQFNVGNESDFDPELMSTILPAAQSEIADKFYGVKNNQTLVDADEYTSNLNKIRTSLKTGGEMPELFTFRSPKLKLGTNAGKKISIDTGYSRTDPSIHTENANENAIARRIRLAVTPDYSGVLYPQNLGDKYKFVNIKDDPKFSDDIRQKNYKFVTALSMDYDPQKFGHWIGGIGSEVKDKDGNVTMTHKDKFTMQGKDVNRLITLDDAAMRASGVRSNEKFDTFIAQAISKSNEIQRMVEADPEKYTIQLSSTSKPIAGMIGPDGAYHIYAWVTVKDSEGKDVSNGDCQLLYDMSIDTYPTPGYNSNNKNKVDRLLEGVNMYIDPNTNGDVRIGGDMRVGKYLNLAKPKIGYEGAYPQVGNPQEDEDFKLIMNALSGIDE